MKRKLNGRNKFECQYVSARSPSKFKNSSKQNGDENAALGSRLAFIFPYVNKLEYYCRGLMRLRTFSIPTASLPEGALINFCIRFFFFYFTKTPVFNFFFFRNKILQIYLKKNWASFWEKLIFNLKKITFARRLC